jgi:hypothetical protein
MVDWPMKEPRYVITRHYGVRNEKGEELRPQHFYRIRRGCTKVCEVWAANGDIRKAYDRKGRIFNAGEVAHLDRMILEASYKTHSSGARFTVMAVLLNNAFDLGTLQEWTPAIYDKIRLPSDPSPHIYVAAVVTYTKAELFSLILDARVHSTATHSA